MSARTNFSISGTHTSAPLVAVVEHAVGVVADRDVEQEREQAAEETARDAAVEDQDHEDREEGGGKARPVEGTAPCGRALEARGAALRGALARGRAGRLAG